MLDQGADRTYDQPVNVRAVATLVLLAALLSAPAALARSGIGDAVPAPQSAAHVGPAATQAVVARDSIATPRATQSRAGTVSVTIGDYFYDPDQVTVNPGDTVLWTNDGTAKEGHTVTDKNGAFDSGVLKNGDFYSHTFDTEGTFSLFCSLHPKMKETVVVEARSSGGGGNGGGGGGGGGGTSTGGGTGSGGGSGSGGGARSGGGSGSGAGGGTSGAGGGDVGGSAGATASGTSPGGSSGGGVSSGASGGGGSLPMSGLDAWLLALIGLDLLLAGLLFRIRLTS